MAIHALVWRVGCFMFYVRRKCNSPIYFVARVHNGLSECQMRASQPGDVFLLTNTHPATLTNCFLCLKSTNEKSIS